jgi:hypothetical protein
MSGLFDSLQKYCKFFKLSEERPSTGNKYYNYKGKQYCFRIFDTNLIQRNMDINTLHHILPSATILRFISNYIKLKYLSTAIISLQFINNIKKRKLDNNKVPKFECLLFDHILPYSDIYFNFNIQISESIGHSMLLFYYFATKTLELYDPNGFGQDFINYQEILQNVKKCLIDKGLNIKNIKCTKSTNNNLGLQTVELKYRTNQNNVLDIPGYCVYWSFIMLELKIMNKVSTKDLESVFMYYLSEIELSDYMRNYAIHIHYMIFKLLQFGMKLNPNLYVYDYCDNVDLIRCVLYEINCFSELIKFYRNPVKYCKTKFGNGEFIITKQFSRILINGQIFRLSELWNRLEILNILE